MPEGYKEIIMEFIMGKVKKAINATIHNIVVEELPKGESSPLSHDLVCERTGDTEFTVYSSSPVWDWLNDGTGIYNPEHAGAGPGGAIVPLNAKALHFKNLELAMAMGFPNEDVFLKKVKGIQPRWFFERHFMGSRFQFVFDHEIDALGGDIYSTDVR